MFQHATSTKADFSTPLALLSKRRICGKLNTLNVGRLGNGLARHCEGSERNSCLSCLTTSMQELHSKGV